MKKIEKEFEIVSNVIERHWNRAIGLANAESLMTYWAVGAFVSKKLKNANWGSKTVEALCDYLKTRHPKRRGFGKRQIYNMVQFYDTYTLPEYQAISERLRLYEFVQMSSAQIEGSEIVHSANAQLCDSGDKCAPFPLFLSLVSFTSHVQILNRSHTMEERIFYILYAARERLNYRDLVRAFASQTYDAVMSKEKKAVLQNRARHAVPDFAEQPIFSRALAMR